MHGLHFHKVHAPKSSEHIDEILTLVPVSKIVSRFSQNFKTGCSYVGSKVFSYFIITAFMLSIVGFALMLAYNFTY